MAWCMIACTITCKRREADIYLVNNDEIGMRRMN